MIARLPLGIFSLRRSVVLARLNSDECLLEWNSDVSFELGHFDRSGRDRNRCFRDVPITLAQ